MTVGRLDEREPGDVAEPDRGHLQDHRGEVRPQDLGVGELGSGVEVLLGVQPDADARRHPTATPSPLVCRRLRDRLDRQALHLQSSAVARDPGGSGVHHVPHTGHRERRLGNIGGQHDPATRAAHRGPLEDLVLLGRRQPCIQRQHLGAAQLQAPQCIRSVVDLALARQEHQHVTGPLVRQLLDSVDDALHLIAICNLRVVDHQRPVSHLHRERPTGDLDHGHRAFTVGEMLGEAGRVDRGAGDDHLQVGSLRQQLAEVPEDEVDVEAAFMRLVDDQRVVAAQHPIALDLGEQNAVGHHLHQRGIAHLVGESHGVADVVTELRAEFGGHTLGDRACGDATRLRVADHAVDAPTRLEAQLRQLRALARPGLASDDHHLVVTDRRQQLLATLRDRQRVRIRQAAPIDDRARRGCSWMVGGRRHGLPDLPAWQLTNVLAPQIRPDPRRER